MEDVIEVKGKMDLYVNSDTSALLHFPYLSVLFGLVYTSCITFILRVAKAASQ